MHFDAGRIIAFWDRDSGTWIEVAATSRKTGGSLLTFQVAEAIVNAKAKRGGRTFAKIIITPDNAGSIAGVYYVMQDGPGAEPKSEWFPEGTVPTWARLLGGESRSEDAGAPEGPSDRPMALCHEGTDTGTVARNYVAEGGETPQVIAKLHQALTRPRWAGELQAANPQRDWTARIYAGDVITIPAAWSDGEDAGAPGTNERAGARVMPDWTLGVWSADRNAVLDADGSTIPSSDAPGLPPVAAVRSASASTDPFRSLCRPQTRASRSR